MKQPGQSVSSQQQTAVTGAGAGGPRLDERGLPRGYQLRDEWELTPRQVRAMLKATPAMVLIDCRTPMETQIAQIPGAKLLPLGDLGVQIQQLRSHLDQKIVIYCHHGVRSLQACWALRQQGFGDAWSMAGGIDLWALDIDRSTPRY